MTEPFLLPVHELRPPEPIPAGMSVARLRERGRTRDKRARRPYTGQERDRRAAAVRRWLATVGPRCPGTRGRGWHEVAPQDLTAEHGHAVAAGGDETQQLTVLCRSCNSSKQDRYIE
jgi:5-methylcytosine-specific restriction endonuclease McrA